jgi:IclR family pca regulon transcriptional regulator
MNVVPFAVRTSSQQSQSVKESVMVRPDRPRAEDFVQSLERGLSVILAFDQDHRRLSLSEVAARTGLTRAVVRRFLLTLVELGYVRHHDGQFSLRPRVLALGHSYLASLSLPEIAQPHMRDLAALTSESVSLAVLDEDEIVYVAQVTAARPMSVRIDVGTRFPAYATAMGRVLIAAQSDDWIDDYLARVELRPFTPYTITSPAQLREVLSEVRRDRYAHVGQELDFSLRALATPIQDGDGETVAALNISTHTRGVEVAVAELLPALQAAATKVEHDLGVSPA